METKTQEQVRQAAEPFSAIALLDSTGRVVAVNQEWGRLTTAGSSFGPGSSLNDIAVTVPGLEEWTMQATDAKHEFSSSNMRVSVQILPLSGPDDAVKSLLLVTARPIVGTEDVAARLRHDIKNRIGGLKLYVTFLKRKLGDQPDLLDVVNKMSDSLDHMNLEANKIRF